MRTGVDLIEISRIGQTLAEHGERFQRRVFTAAEWRLCGGRPAALAGRWAAKEAAAKALGCGIGDVAWLEIEILNDARGAPILRLHGAAARLAAELGLDQWTISLSHSRDLAIALVIAY
ncbi:MAG: holo-ACP synthase [Caldilineales bacterium]|nr:holo-ACP synthase [Caldilineales bacterium]